MNTFYCKHTSMLSVLSSRISICIYREIVWSKNLSYFIRIVSTRITLLSVSGILSCVILDEVKVRVIKMSTSQKYVALHCYSTSICIDQACLSPSTNEWVFEAITLQYHPSMPGLRFKLDERSFETLRLEYWLNSLYPDEIVFLYSCVRDWCEIVAAFSTDPFWPEINLFKISIWEFKSRNTSVKE